MINILLNTKYCKCFTEESNNIQNMLFGKFGLSRPGGGLVQMRSILFIITVYFSKNKLKRYVISKQLSIAFFQSMSLHHNIEGDFEVELIKSQL